MKGPGYRDTATCKENFNRFLSRVVASGTVWGLKGENGWAIAESNEHPEASVLLFWSDEAYARRAQEEFPQHTPASISLFDFLYRWLPGMSGDGVLAGANWTGDLVGLETDPFELRTQIEAALPPEVASEYWAQCEKAKRQ
jgi:hypothetical protein